MKVILSPAITLDGIIADVQGDCYSWVNQEDEQRYEDEIERIGCELVGRKTYVQYKDSFNARQDIITFVYTSQSFHDTHNVKFLNGDPRSVIRQIEEYGFTELIFSGGGELNGSLADAGVINEIQLSIHPLTLGNGIRLFGTHNLKMNLVLIGGDTQIKGILRATYRVL